MEVRVRVRPLVKGFLIWCLAFVICSEGLDAGTLHLKVRHQYKGKPLLLNSIRYGGGEKYSLSRVSYLLSGFELVQEDGKAIQLKDQYAYIDHSSRRLSLSLVDVPPGSYVSLRFSVGVPPHVNHATPVGWAANHPLNPEVNGLHWSWQGGYIFMALEGKYRDSPQSLSGFVYHLANDENSVPIEIPCVYRVKSQAELVLGMDVAKVLHQPRMLSFVDDGASTHSHKGDPIASALVANLTGAWSFIEDRYPAGERPQKTVQPLYLPEHFTPYRFKMSSSFSMPNLPRDNPLIVERVELGERLFNDVKLSRDNSISCAHCHHEDKSFTDAMAMPLGIRGQAGKRNTMPLFNLAWKNTFFWDGRASSLREQVLMPIHDPLEMDLDLDSMVEKVQANSVYRRAFKEAFSGDEITKEKVALALESFILTLTSYQSKFDRAMQGKDVLSESEKRGMELFFSEFEPRSGSYGADCFHCHGGANFSDHRLHNNGLPPASGDYGRFHVTGDAADRGKFSTPSLRNLTHTAPYMHDGRFATLGEVVEHYSGELHASESLDPNLAKHPKAGLQLSAEDKKALVAFLKTLSEDSAQ